MFKSADEARTYLLAGHATVTVSSQRTGARYTYRVTRAKDEQGQPKDLWFVGLLSGPDNEADYAYVGAINGTFKLTRKSRMSADSTPVKAFAYLYGNLAAGRMPPEAEVRHEGHCGRCGRTLTVPESIDRGIGPECVHKMGI